MFLVTAATPGELTPFRRALDSSVVCPTLLTGVGVLESALHLGCYLQSYTGHPLTGVLNIGVAGAFPECDVHLLDLCLAEQEIFADFGISLQDTILPFDFPGAPSIRYLLPDALRHHAVQLLHGHGLSSHQGNFVTVSSVSGTALRGRMLRDTHQAICENMEGFAVARVCDYFKVPLLEMRCVSNYVEERDRQNWMVQEAAEKVGQAAALLLSVLSSSSKVGGGI